MRNLNRNKRTIYYALHTGDTPDKDEYGNETGESTPTYGEQVALECNISAAGGEEIVKAFGSFTAYNRTICISGTTCQIDEKSAVWFNTDPTKPHNHIVVRKADSKNGILYALREVMVT